MWFIHHNHIHHMNTGSLGCTRGREDPTFRDINLQYNKKFPITHPIQHKPVTTRPRATQRTHESLAFPHRREFECMGVVQYHTN